MRTKQPRRRSSRDRRASCCWSGIIACAGRLWPPAMPPAVATWTPWPPPIDAASGNPCNWKPKREGNRPKPAESVMLPKRAVPVGPPEPAMKLKPWCRCCCSWVCLAVSGRCPAGRCGMLTPGTVLVRGSTLPILPLPYKGITFSSSTLALHTGHSWQTLCICNQR